MTIKDDPNGGQSEDDKNGGDDCALRPCEGEPDGDESEYHEHEADGGMGIAARHESLIDMRAVRGKDVLTPKRALNERDARVHDDRPHQKRAKHKRVATFVCGKQRQNGEGVTKEGAGDIAHENFRGRPVMN